MQRASYGWGCPRREPQIPAPIVPPQEKPATFPHSAAPHHPALRRRPDPHCGGPSPGRTSPRRMGITGPGQQHLALAHWARSTLPRRVVVAPASYAPPCPAGILGPAWLRMGLSSGGSRARLRSPHPSFLLPSLGLSSGRPSRPFLALILAPLVFPHVFTFQQRKSAFRLRTRFGPLQQRQQRGRWRPRQFQETGRGRHTFHTPASPPFPAPTSAPLPG